MSFKASEDKFVVPHFPLGKVDKQSLRIEALEHKLKLKDVELSIQKEFGKESFSGVPFKGKLKRLMDFVCEAFDPELAFAYLFDEETGELVLAAHKGATTEKAPGEVRLSIKHFTASTVVSTNRAVHSANLMKEPTWIKKLAGGMAMDTVAVPLRFRRRLTGVIQIVNRADAPTFSAADIKSLQSFTSQFSAVATKAYVFDDLKERIKGFATLNDVGGLLISTLKEESIRHRAMTAITGLVEAETGSILIIDRETKELYFEVALGDHGKKVKELRLSIDDKSIAGWVAKYGKPLIVNDVRGDERFNATIDDHADFITKNILCVPIRVKGKMLGVLQAVNKKNGAFVKRDQDIFQIFSSQVAIALDNARLHGELRQAFFDTSEALAEAIEKRDPYTGGHTKRVLRYCLATASRLGMTKSELEDLKLAAILHDVGKIGIDDRILKKEAPLDSLENKVMMEHPLIGAEILKRVPHLKDVVPGTLYHHERVDGKGYPSGFKGEEIPLMARIIAVADTFDAMTTDRPYRKGLSDKVAIAELQKCAGSQFDPDVVEAFIAVHACGEFDKMELLDFQEGRAR